MLEPIAPKTKPSCTPMVSHADKVGVKFHMDCNFGMTAVAENHVVMDKTMQIDKMNNARKRPAG